MHPTKGRDLTLRRLLGIAAVLSLFLLPSTAAAPPSFHAAEWKPPGCSKIYSRGDFHREARKAVRRPPLTSRERTTVKRILRCQVSPRSERNVRFHWGRFKSAYRRRLVAIRVARLTPFAGPNGTRWAIPWPIVSCESGGDFREYNEGYEPHGPGSGPGGAYQIIRQTWRGHGGAGDARYAPPARQHIIAARIWAGGRGRGQWQC